MKKTILLAALSLSLFADNPNVYSSLGDVIYDNVENVKNLKKIEKYDQFIFKIDAYCSDVENTKQMGYSIESGKNKDLGLNYLQKLRKLSKMDDYFTRSANSSFDSSIKNKDNSLFIGIVNSGLLDAKKNKKRILGYYNLNKDDINGTGIIQTMIDEDNAKKVKRKSYYKSKKQIEKERIQRIRNSDKYKQEMLEKKLQKELELKKEQIRAEQERELFN